MKNHQKRQLLFISSIILGVLALSACMPTSPEISSEQLETEQPAIEETDVTSDVSVDTIEEISTDKKESLPSESNSINSSGLSDAEINSLVFMREEEKLARDVYLALYDLWGLQIFQNIANSEQTHTDAVANLLDRYDIPDPADTSPAGVFVNSDLQSLYDELTETGAQSLRNALKVGAAIEEIDILDLQEYLGIIEEQAIRQVYENLLKGSENHLRAFTSTLEKQTGEIYQPQYMTQDAYNAIVSDDNRRGGRGKGRRS
ncbi:MAG: DUF2202 domain-containing protein [Chloroflexota bacterium]|nr:DUF2202 domain-containing protein [Chloroflexota bacterium]